ncbi:uncharacterized protein KGF55_000688 [Candida pseudojiufengensis]|uniref:uncharacterized protein n=1 Tax=Candida pseudojiufengensis TaxID=497109 RepID=UPI0022255507|nr:uncharacterized protein KGF55_000688 [Candida pseudojiufengensis]KAI5966379.1 hypothetical protein KGF55_000688 [Candida pseudojiufengensis]
MFAFHIITLLVCFITSLVKSSPISSSSSPIEGSQFEIIPELDFFVESQFNEYEVGLYYDVMDIFNNYNSEDLIYKRDNSTNDGGMQLDNDALSNTITTIIRSVNDSGVIWALLDAIADHPSRIDYISNLTSTLLEGRNITIDVGDLLSGEPDPIWQKNVNLTAIMNAIQESGLVDSFLDGFLLDTVFRPRLVDIIDRVVWSQRDALLYIFNVLLVKRGFIDEEDVKDILKRADSANNGTLNTFLTNSIATVLGSGIFGQVAGDLLNALNDTEVAVYVVKRFLSNDAYLNMTARLFNSLTSAGAIHISFESLNVTNVLNDALSDPTRISLIVGSLLSGDSSLITNYFGRYSGAIQDILAQLEAKGLFARLNSYIWGNPSATTSITLAPSATSNANRNAITTTTTSSSSLTTRVADANSNQSKSNNAGSLQSNYKLQALVLIPFGFLSMLFII